jgi:hypothetical protein
VELKFHSVISWILFCLFSNKIYHGRYRWLSPVSSNNTTDHHDITEILLKVALNIITLTPNPEDACTFRSVFMLEK